ALTQPQTSKCEELIEVAQYVVRNMQQNQQQNQSLQNQNQNNNYNNCFRSFKLEVVSPEGEHTQNQNLLFNEEEIIYSFLLNEIDKLLDKKDDD
ncbi:16460_t:CDS:2, partial [Dentiscutata erythropus]